MLTNKFLKRNWNTLFIIILLIGILSIISSGLFNVPLLSKIASADNTIEQPHISYIHLTQFCFFILGALLIFSYFKRSQIKKSLLKNHPNSYPRIVHILTIALVIFIIFLAIFYWQDETVYGEGELFNDLEASFFVLSAIVCFTSFLLLKNESPNQFFKRKKYFFLIFSIILFLALLMDTQDIHAKLADLIIALLNLPVNHITMEIHAIFPLILGAIGLFTFIKFWSIIKENKMMNHLILAAIVIGIIVIIIDITRISFYLEEALEMLLSVLFFNSFIYAFFDNL